MQIAVHWQDADSSSAKAVSDVFPDAEIMICGGHAGRAHKKILELRHKMKKVSKTMIQKYKDTFPALGKLRCDSCHIWYHRHCMDISSEVFGESEVHW